MTTLFSIMVCMLFLALITLLFMKQPKFGSKPKGLRLQRIQQSPNYRAGAFQNQHHTPALTEGASYIGILKKFATRDKSLSRPTAPLPSVKTDLHSLSSEEQVLIWFGHSSYFLQVDGKRILVDPVFSGAASPVSFTTRAFPGSDIYKPEDMPEIDILFISHDHWDHLDYATIKALRPKVDKVVTGLGTGAHLERWGYEAGKIIEADWHERIDLGAGFVVHTVPGRHFSGRGFKRNGALWLSFALQTPGKNIYLGGDSGYDTHFAEAGKHYGPFDLAILENGQYDANWKYIHMHPHETLQAAKDLRAKRLLAVHSSKFSLANHAWNEPLREISSLAEQSTLPLLTPRIGEKVVLNNEYQRFTKWWE